MELASLFFSSRLDTTFRNVFFSLFLPQLLFLLSLYFFFFSFDHGRLRRSLDIVRRRLLNIRKWSMQGSFNAVDVSPHPPPPPPFCFPIKLYENSGEGTEEGSQLSFLLQFEMCIPRLLLKPRLEGGEKLIAEHEIEISPPSPVACLCKAKQEAVCTREKILSTFRPIKRRGERWVACTEGKIRL